MSKFDWHQNTNISQNFIDTRTQPAGNSLNSEFVEQLRFFDTKLAEAALAIYGLKNLFFPNARPPGHLVWLVGLLHDAYHLGKFFFH